MSTRGGAPPLSPASWRIHPAGWRSSDTGTVVIHRRFRRVISNAESAIYASGARMGGVAPSAVPLAPTPFLVLRAHTRSYGLSSPPFTTLPSPPLFSSFLLGVPTFTPLFHRSTAMLDICVCACVSVCIYIYICIGVRAVIPAKYWWCVALFIATSPLSRQQGR